MENFKPQEIHYNLDWSCYVHLTKNVWEPTETREFQTLTVNVYQFIEITVMDDLPICEDCPDPGLFMKTVYPEGNRFWRCNEIFNEHEWPHQDVDLCGGCVAAMASLKDDPENGLTVGHFNNPLDQLPPLPGTPAS